jgi:hypothetical protein
VRPVRTLGDINMETPSRPNDAPDAQPDLPDAEHESIAHLRIEFSAARHGVRTIGELDAPHRERVLDGIRAALPDVASRAAHAVGSDVAVAEIRRFSDIEVTEDTECGTVEIWGEIVAVATEAATAAR